MGHVHPFSLCYYESMIELQLVDGCIGSPTKSNPAATFATAVMVQLDRRNPRLAGLVETEQQGFSELETKRNLANRRKQKLKVYLSRNVSNIVKYQHSKHK